MGEESDTNVPPPSSTPKPSPPPPSLSKPITPPPMIPVPPKPVEPPPQARVDVGREDDAEVDETTPGAIAALNPRLLGAVIDFLVASGLGAAAVLILPDMLDRFAWLVGAGYMVTRDSLPFLKGQSVGKTAMKLKVVKADGSGLVNDWQTGLIRNVLLLIPIAGPLVEAIVLVSRDGKAERGKRLGDEWAKTKVIVAPADEAAE